MPMTNTQARDAVLTKLESLTVAPIRYENAPDFKVPQTGLWINFAMQYADSFPSALQYGTMERDFGILNFQVFARKGTGIKSMVALAEDIRELFRGFSEDKFEITQTHAPTTPENEETGEFVVSLVRCNFRLN